MPPHEPPHEPGRRGPGLSRVVALAAATAAGLALWWQVAPAPPPEVPETRLPTAAVASGTAAASALASGPTTGRTNVSASSTPPSPGQGVADAAQDLAAHVPPGQAPAMAEVIQRLNQAGVRSGLGAFNPPGTRPPLLGLAVPEDFELPPGFVRHHQATDDGQRIEAVLMFAPDHPYVLAHPELRQRPVPPEMAPEGLPLRTIALPAPRSRQP